MRDYNKVKNNLNIIKGILSDELDKVYDLGYKDGFNDCSVHLLLEEKKRMYDCGVNFAWSVAKVITQKNEYSLDTLRELFPDKNWTNRDDILYYYTLDELVSRLRGYERCFKVPDIE